MSRGFLLFFAIGLLRHLHCFGGLGLHGLHRFHGIHHIGLGGGAASSMASGQSDADLDFASVQRDNPEMERRRG